MLQLWKLVCAFDSGHKFFKKRMLEVRLIKPTKNVNDREELFQLRASNIHFCAEI